VADVTGPSPELEAIFRRWVDATIRGDGRTVRNLLSPDPGTLYCGTGADETITGRALQDGIAAHIGEVSGAAAELIELHTHQSGETGWAHGNVRVRRLETGEALLWRLSLVFHLEDGVWKAHLAHGSYATDYHVTKMGMDHTAFQDLLSAAQNLDPQIGRGESATVMFTDILGSTALAEALGDTRWTQEIKAHVQLLKECVEAEDGRLIKSLGDGTMSTFSSAGAGLRTAQKIQCAMAGKLAEPHLRVRIGLHTGDVLDAGDDFFGTVVNKAARIADAAQAGEICVSDATRIMVGNAVEFTFTDPVATALKGFDGQHLIHQLEWQS
jgi:class 3 adenylate cyclase